MKMRAIQMAQVYYNPEDRTWDINARACDDDGNTTSWSGPTGIPEGELAEGLAVARDIMTGG